MGNWKKAVSLVPVASANEQVMDIQSSEASVQLSQ